jgi:hypothetical protein
MRFKLALKPGGEMKMIRVCFNRLCSQAFKWAGVIALSGALGAAIMAQDIKPSAGQRTDAQIEMDVVHALDASDGLKDDLITAATIQGEVALSGTVSSEAASELAEMIASNVQGVVKVTNNLKVGNIPEAQAAQSTNTGVPAAAMAPGSNPTNFASATSSSGPQPGPVSGAVTIPEGTLLQVRTSEALNSKWAQAGTQIQFDVIRDVSVNGVLAIPRGATVHGVVADTKKPGQLSGHSELALELTSLDLGGQSYPLQSDLFKVKGPSEMGRAVRNAFGSALLGALIGGFVDRGTGAAIGAVAGAGAGTAITAATPGPDVWIPAEALVDFHLTVPLTVTPVSPAEAARLAQGLFPAGPYLHRRRFYPYEPLYAYPPMYFRPYYDVGGIYYWR